MTVVRVLRGPGGLITGFIVRGHAGYAPKGEDLVCAGVSSAVGMAECALSDVLGLKPEVSADARTALVSCRVAPEKAELPGARAVLEAFALHMKALAEQYEAYLRVEDVYPIL